ncbi:Hypothetical predicted protein [Argonauta hians]
MAMLYYLLALLLVLPCNWARYVPQLDQLNSIRSDLITRDVPSNIFNNRLRTLVRQTRKRGCDSKIGALGGQCPTYHTSLDLDRLRYLESPKSPGRKKRNITSKSENQHPTNFM